VHFRGIDVEAAFFDEIDSQLAEPVALVVTAELIAKAPSEPAIAVG